MGVAGWGYNKMCVIGNMNSGNTPYMIIADISKLFNGEKLIEGEQKFDLDLFKQSNDENKFWSMSTLHYSDHANQKIIWERLCNSGLYLDVYNPMTNSVTFSEKIDEAESKYVDDEKD